MRLAIKSKRNKLLLLLLIILACCSVLTGCWNYKEIEQLAIVAGAAVDKNEDGSVHLTVEIVDIGSDGSTTYKPVYLESDGATFFEAVRRTIAMEGKRMYWSHAKVVIVSEDIAKGDINKYLDFLFRDPEAREDIWLLVSQEKTAKEVLLSKGELKPIVSFQIDDTMRAQNAISRFPYIELFEFFDRMFYKQVAPILPAVHLIEQEGEKTPEVAGTAIFKNNKLVGYLPVEPTKCMLFLRDEVKGGIIPLEDVAGTKDDVSLEIFKSKTKLTPIFEDEEIIMKADIQLDVSVGELMGTIDLLQGAGKEKLRKSAEKMLEEQIQAAYTMVRDQYGTDVFGFGRVIDMKQPKAWAQIKDQWDDWFKRTELDVSVHLKVRGSATTRTPLKVGE